ncbi:MAG: hypothetical protein HQ542_06215, partial [Bacteroidia bacterium]|nr:hypothetical protein [Bacteroidia bacterium]
FNTGNTIDTLFYHVTPVLDGCMGDPNDIQVVVKPEPVVTNPVLFDTLCTGTLTNIVLTSNLINPTFSWTASGTSPNVTGYSNGTGSTILQTLYNTGDSLEDVIYEITPYANNCTGSLTEFRVLVCPFPDLTTTPSSQMICSGDSTGISLSSSIPGTAFHWTASAGSANVTGYSSGTGNVIHQVLYNAAFTSDSVIYLVIPNLFGCQGSSDEVIITVKPAPVVSLSNCFDTITTTNAKPIQLRGGIPLGGTYGGTGVTGSTFYPAIAGPGIHQITYSYTNFANCSDIGYRILDVKSASPFTCGDSLLDIRDSTTYPTVQIGTQCWLASNLNYGNVISHTTPQRDNCIPEKYQLAVGSWQSAVYQWDELMNYSDLEEAQGFCPPGWHVPSESDWNTLFAVWTNNAFAGAPLKYSGYSGFNALLIGAGFFNKVWEYDAFATFFWSSTSHGPFKARAHGMNDYNYSVSYYPSYRANAFGVRCVRD